jgi:hypothetical protein
MRCLSCNVALSDKEASRKFKNHEEIRNPEDKYIGLCAHCLGSAEIDELELNQELLEVINLEN